ncbi:MAG: hypothetical protein ACFBRM_01770 [Pikeienuella sp.]
MRWIFGAAVGFVGFAGLAAAQEGLVDVTGTWGCSISDFAPGEAPEPQLFNMALARDGGWALSGRMADGEIYRGAGTWRYGRAGLQGVTIVFEGTTQPPGRVAQRFSAEADVVDETEISRRSQQYGRTRIFECLRRGTDPTNW